MSSFASGGGSGKSDRLDNLSSYFKEKDRKKLTSDVKSKWGDGSTPLMSEEEIRLSCLENNGYDSPELNDKIYLHFRGFKRIENLDKYTGCKAIWLDSNGFEKLEGLQALTELRCLYLSKNLIQTIENLNNLTNLIQLDLSNNRITHLQNLSCCPNLESLNLQRNYLATSESIAHLIECPKIMNLDLQNNKLPAEESIMDVMVQFPSVCNLQLTGNEVTRLPTFRKRMIFRMPKLGYLDRPVEELERICATAFVNGGSEAEAAAREQYRLDKVEAKKIELQNFKKWQFEQQEKRKQDRANGVASAYQGYVATPEEEERRLKEAKKAWDEEQAALAGGIGKLASKYWELDGKQENRNKDVLAMASQAIIAERERRNDINDIDDDSEEDEESEEIISSGSSAAGGGSGLTEAIEVSDADVEKQVAEEQLAKEKAEKEEAEKLQKEEEARIQKAELKKKKEEDDRRAVLVAESLAMYKRQLAEEKENAERKAKGLPPLTRSMRPLANASNANSSNEEDSASVPSKPKQFHWTEDLDIELASRVRKAMFDFKIVSEDIRKIAISGGLGLFVQQHAASITTEACRIRWAELDASKWSQVSPDVQALDTIYKVCVKPQEPGKTSGRPSWDQLNTIATSSFPKYLTPPSLLPSIGDIESDSEEELKE